MTKEKKRSSYTVHFSKDSDSMATATEALRRCNLKRLTDGKKSLSLNGYLIEAIDKQNDKVLEEHPLF
jgi:hypothetical protein